MQYNQFTEQANQLLNLELQQIHMAAHLAMFAPNECVRSQILHIIDDELAEAKFLNHVLCSLSNECMPVSPGVPYPGIGTGDEVCPGIGTGPGMPCPGMGPGLPCPGAGPIPGILPPAGPAATLPPSVPIAPPNIGPGLFPGIYPGVPYVEKEKKEEEKK